MKGGQPPDTPPRQLEPTCHFARRPLITDEFGRAETVLVSELVRKGQLLADFPDCARLEQRGFVKRELRSGANTEFSPDGQSLLASVIGYPKIDEMEQDLGAPVLIISVVPLVRVSFDRMNATLLIQPSLPGCTGLQSEALGPLLEEAGLRFGIDEEALKEAQRIIASGRIESCEIAIASGALPGAGSDASLDFAVEIGPLAGHLLPDGTIDYRERRIMIGIRRDELIATKIPAVPGSPGTNVLGESIESKTGRDIKVRTIGDATFDPETLEVRATKDGILSVVRHTDIKVSARHTLNSDIDFQTGNIESEGCLVVRGSIQPGFKVRCGGDLEIGGSVMAASITGESNLVVKGGITGKNARVTVQGDADIRFIEQARLAAGGIAVIRTQAYYSRVTALSDIRCQPSAIIMGGALIAGGHLSVGTVGSENSEPATLAAGVDPERLELYKELQVQLKHRQDEIIQWLQMHGNTRSRKVRKMEAGVDQIRLQLLTLNLIPGTELFSRAGRGGSREEIEEENPLYHAGLDVDKIRIDVHGTAYPGTRLLLGNRFLTLRQTASKRQFKLSGDMKRIIALPLRR